MLENGDYDDIEEYFNQIERVRKKALQHDIPFCNIVQAVGTNGTSVSWDSPGDGEHLDWRTPNRVEHRWLVYSSLTYGVHGIVWFHWDYCDWGIIENPDRDIIYPSLQSINAEIDSLKDIMLSLKTKTVYHLNGKQRTRLNGTLDIVFEALPQSNLIVGTFVDKNKNDNYFMLMNKDYNDSVSVQMRMDYILDDLEVFNVDDNTWENVFFSEDDTGTNFSVNLREGDGKLYRFEGDKIVPPKFDFTISPNPFETSTIISYSIPEMFNEKNSHNVTLDVYDLQGRKITTLINESQTSGKYFVDFKSSQVNVSSSVYLFVLKIDEKQIVRKLIKQ